MRQRNSFIASTHLRILGALALVLVISLATAGARAQSPDKLTLDQLAHLQEMLIWTGHLDAEVGRVPIEELVEAIESFQKANRYPVTGKIKPAELQTLTRQGEQARASVGFQIIDDPKTGIRVGMPTSLLGPPSPATHGPHWGSSDGAISINALAIPLSRHTLDSLYQRMCCEISGRKVEHKDRYPDWFVIEGTDGENAVFHVRAHTSSTEVRGLSVVISKKRRKELMPIVNAMASTFRPFPMQPAAVAARPAAPQPMAQLPVQAPPPPAIAAFSVELPKGGTVPAPKPEPANRMSDEAQVAHLKQQVKELHGKLDRLLSMPAQSPLAIAAPLPGSAPALAGKRVALVVGNTMYQNTAELLNPHNDARALTELLRSFGFEVIEGLDLDYQSMVGKIREYARALDDADVGLFFYAGHALQADGRNYLMPIDAKLERESHILRETIDLGEILKHLDAQAKTKIVILDACRDNPLARRLAGSPTRSAALTRSFPVSDGLAEVKAGAGTLIAFSTEPGKVALDGRDKHSPFSGALLKHMPTPGLEIGMLFRRVREDVIRSTNGRQVPWEQSSLGAAAIAFSGAAK